MKTTTTLLLLIPQIMFSQTLADSLSFSDYSIVEFNEQFFLEDTGILLKFLADYNQEGYSVFDADDNQVVNTADQLLFLLGFNITWDPPTDCLTIGQNFGEGNTELLGPCDGILFGFFKRSPADEEDVWYYGYDVKSFSLEYVTEGAQILRYTFIKK